MTPALFLDVALSPALRMLPPKMDTPEARALLVAIALQESELRNRRQMSGGPARGYFQFERAGVTGVLKHRVSSELARAVCGALDLAPTVGQVHRAIEYHDVLAVGFARLLLWTLPVRLPTRHEPKDAYAQYIDAWRPGTPRPADWPANFTAAWRIVERAD